MRDEREKRHLNRNGERENGERERDRPESWRDGKGERTREREREREKKKHKGSRADIAAPRAPHKYVYPLTSPGVGVPMPRGFGCVGERFVLYAGNGWFSHVGPSPCVREEIAFAMTALFKQILEAILFDDAVGVTFAIMDSICSCVL